MFDTCSALVFLTLVGWCIGWDQGCLGMSLGEVRVLTIPASEGYGKGGFPEWGIPPGATLQFTMECLDIEKA